jgi:hypothetical protein
MNKEEICCPVFISEPWDDKVHEWSNKLFVKDKVFTLFYMPMNFGSVMKRLNERVESAGAKMPDNLCLSNHTSKWNMDVYLAVDKRIAGAENVTISGKLISRVYEGPFKDTGKWCEDFEKNISAKGLTAQKQYMWYTTCPKCAKKYGKNYVVILGQIA